MAGPSAPKQEIRCTGVLKTGKRRGNPCHGLLIAEDGTIACHNCGDHYSLLDVLDDAVARGIVGKEMVIAAMELSAKNGGEEMPAQIKTKTEMLQEWIARFKDDASANMRAKALFLEGLGLDPDRIEKMLNMPMRFGDAIPLAAHIDGYIRNLELQFYIKGQPAVPVRIVLCPFVDEGLRVYLRIGNLFEVRRVFSVENIEYKEYPNKEGVIAFVDSKKWSLNIQRGIRANRILVYGDNTIFDLTVEPEI